MSDYPDHLIKSILRSTKTIAMAAGKGTDSFAETHELKWSE
jgi:hypothetical protein